MDQHIEIESESETKINSPKIEEDQTDDDS